jgi:surface carbohydrate biosynthesis protein (TIGR04326 family)
MISNKNILILSEQTIDKKEDSEVVVSWNEMVVPSGVISLPIKTEEQAISIKAEFLSWVHELGNTVVDGQSLISHLKIFNNLSFWWMTLVAEKSPFLCDSIFQIFKLRTLEKIYLDKGCEGLVYRGNHKQLHTVLKTWSFEMGHYYQWIPSPSDNPIPSSEGFREKLIRKTPHIFQGIAWLIKQWFERWRHVNSIHSNSKKNDQAQRPTIVTFFPNIHLDLAKEGKFRSKYWEKLHDYIERENIPVDWVWFYFRSKDISFQKSIELKNKFNQNPSNNQRYFLLEEFISRGELWKCFTLFIRLRRKTRRLNHLKKSFCFSGSKINFFPIIEDNWSYSFWGKGAVEKIVWAVMFDSMAKKIPVSPWGLYTWENQTWERALVSALRRHRPDTKVIGYEHSSIRLMDLRLFSDSRTYEGKGIEELPIPDILGVNSSTGLEWMRESEYPSESIARVEALRYFHLNGKFRCLKKPTPVSGRKLLMVTGIIPEEARFQMELLKQAEEDGGLEKYDEIWIKPHPGLTLDFLLKELKPKFKFTIVTRPIIELMGESDVVYCANSTGASLEAAWIGIPLIILAAKDSMNLNPLFGFSDQKFIKDCAELLLALENPKPVEIPEDYFFLDETLESWKEILKL